MAARPPGVALAFALFCTAPDARALDPFEIQVYDGTANAPRVVGLELHLNHVATGYLASTPPELPLHGQTHLTLEPSFGLFPWWELGAYLQTSVRADGHDEYAGAKLRNKFVTPPSFHPHLRFGLNVEVSFLPTTYDRDQWAMELRPIAAWEDEGWLLAVNPIVGVGLAGGSFRSGPTFEPCLKIARRIGGVFALGGEYYGDIGPIASPEPLAQQTHQLFGVADIDAFEDVEIELGLGGGITPASAGLIGKVILGYSFDLHRLAARPR
jgi:hypothetical protein